jgi:putative transposase
VDSLALANEQLHLESAYKNFFRDKNIGFSKYKCKHRCKDSYTTNLANGNIVLDDKYIRLPKLGMVKILIHRRVPSVDIPNQLQLLRDLQGDTMYLYCMSMMKK